MIRQFTTTFKVLFTIVVVLLGGLLVTGNFRVDTDHATQFGVYDSSLAGLPAFYNPAIDTLAFLEYVSLFLLPVLLLIGRARIKPLREVPVIPWLILAMVILFATYVWPHALALGSNAIDPTVTSELPSFLQAQIPLVIGLVLGYGLLMLKLKLCKERSTSSTPRERLSQRCSDPKARKNLQ